MKTEDFNIVPDSVNIPENDATAKNQKSEKNKKLAGEAAKMAGAAAMGVGGTMAAQAMINDDPETDTTTTQPAAHTTVPETDDEIQDGEVTQEEELVVNPDEIDLTEQLGGQVDDNELTAQIIDGPTPFVSDPDEVILPELEIEPAVIIDDPFAATEIVTDIEEGEDLFAYDDTTDTVDDSIPSDFDSSIIDDILS